MTTRRRAHSLLALSICAVSLLALPGAASAAKGFRFGVTAAEVRVHSAILWARTTKPGRVDIQLAAGNADFSPCRAGRSRLRSIKGNDLTVQERVRDLEAGTNYSYRFCMRGGRRSSIGHFSTPPLPRQSRTITFALAGDQDALPRPGKSQPFWNDFGVWDRIRAEGNDFNVMMGDTIYSDTEVPGYGRKNVAITVPAKWRKYRINLGQSEWTQARGSAAYYAHWDDHEFINDFSTKESRFPLGVGTINIDGRKLYRRGVRAFRDYNPVTYSRRNGIYRSFRWGQNLEVFFLDERSFRSRSADYNGACDNPQTGEPDLAPTAPQTTRNIFSALVPSLGAPVSQKCKNKINDSKRTMLGARQLRRFKQAIRRSTATFKVVMNEVPIQQFYALPYDRWEGYEAERKNLVRSLRSIDNVVFLTTDDHANLVNDVRLKTLEQGGPVNSGITEVTNGPIATATYRREIEDSTGTPGSAGAIQQFFFKPDPPAGVGMDCASLDYFSYAEVTVRRRQLKIELRTIDGEPVPDNADREQAAPPCDDIVIQAE